MDISGLISALVVGVIIGALGRLVLPGRQQVGLLWTIVVGIVAALIGTGIADAVGVADTRGFDWIELLIQVALAAVGVGALERARGGGRVRR
ncbi:GlsB/YeaQ/YmgE family stress response membrane protein [Streptomyces sp. CA-250714]|uniref:GlsB/YeaQ/YmgE family stress response membrane protein n=1 Tax=Streptomyces sp. CA-250714 TaxID=3240060 RepID=UPI003D9224E8